MSLSIDETTFLVFHDSESPNVSTLNVLPPAESNGPVYQNNIPIIVDKTELSAEPTYASRTMLFSSLSHNM